MDTKRGETKDALAEKLVEGRERTRWLLRTVSDEDLVAQHDRIMSPLIWDYGHVGNYEELWLLRKAHGRELSDRELYDVYDASLTPRSKRPSLAMLDRASADRYLDRHASTFGIGPRQCLVHIRDHGLLDELRDLPGLILSALDDRFGVAGDHELGVELPGRPLMEES